MTKSLTILFKTEDAVGHINPCIGVAEVLRESGHRIVFAVGEQWSGKLSAYGFEEEITIDPQKDPNEDSVKFFVEQTKRVEALLEKSMDERVWSLFNIFVSKLFENAKRYEDAILEQIVNKYKPDVIVIDKFIVCPSLLKTGIPWVYLCSGNPLFYLPKSENLPPPAFGLSIYGDKNEWSICRTKLNDAKRNVHNRYNEWLREYGLTEIPESAFFYPSPHLNILNFPKEIDYSNEERLPSNFYGFDYFMRSEKSEEFVLPEDFKNKSGKIVYFSLGSIASENVELMKRLISILSKSPHKFIVSMGKLHDQYELADNMWGQSYLPQTKVLPLVDLVITHGGNNTLTETFYFGKPLIVMPLFGDQPDNAQRMEDTGYGIRLDAFKCTETELLGAIEKLFNNSDLKIKLENISKRIQTSKGLNKVVDLIEKLVK